MRGIALSDTHLGFRAFPGRVVDGRNARELDVERAWQHAIDQIVLAQPDLVTVAGDVFHNVKPDMWAVRAFMVGIQRISYETDAHVVIIGGNHCMPRTAETATPSIVVTDMPGVHLVTEPRRLLIETECGERVSVSCFPFVALTEERKYSLEPDPSADVNVLLVHAAVQESENGGKLPFFYGNAGSLDVGREADRWDVVACGDYHEFTRLHPTALAFYSGAIERTSSDIWKEKQEKGLVLYDTAKKDLEFIEIPTRPVVDLTLDQVIDASVYEGQPRWLPLNDALESFSQYAGGEIVRLKVPTFPRSQRDGIHWGVVKHLKEKFFHFQLEIEWTSSESSEFGDRRNRRGRSFEQDAREYFAGDEDAVRDCILAHLQLEAA
jgi:DNA repair exonuclease SbcCD nuclease subunit